MALEIPAYNLFMMCQQPRREAFCQMPSGYFLRKCRREEVETWIALNSQEISQRPFLWEYYRRVYGKAEEVFFQKCTFVCDENDRPVGTCFLWKAYGKITTLHWLKVLPQLEGLGLGRGLLSHVLGEAAQEEYPIYLHTHPGCFRAVHLYQEFGFQLLEGPAVGNRSNDLKESLPYLREAMPAPYFQKLQVRETPQELLEAAAGLPEEF
ncbi:MAG: GNAT family N-acetyltransferase [Acutalibacter sp.]|jgi:GNAT superfamily N-acetyltransferase